MTDFFAQLDRLPSLFGLSLAQSLAIAGGVHVIAGVSAAIVAIRKGKDWKWWVLIGLMAGTPALIVAVKLKSESD